MREGSEETEGDAISRFTSGGRLRDGEVRRKWIRRLGDTSLSDRRIEALVIRCVWLMSGDL